MRNHTAAIVMALTASQSAFAAKPVDPAERRAAVQAIEARIDRTYVFENLRAPIVEALERGLRQHRYDTSDPDIFAQRITQDMQMVAHDGHLYLDNDPQGYVAELAPPKSEQGLPAYYREVAIRENSGLAELRILPGNIRYLKLTAFHWTPGITPKAYDEAADFLKDGDAIIVDLRGNGGGDSDAGDYFSKAFVTPNRGKPFYILVDGHVASAGEAVPYGLQYQKAAVIVGSTTYGAANNNEKFPIAPSFVLSVSYNRPINPISKTNWEGTGVIPDINVPGSKALETAELDALSKLSGRPGLKPEKLAEYDWARIRIEAKLHPQAIPMEVLDGYAGHYGPISVRMSPEGLRLSRSDRPRWEQDAPLIPLDGKGLFSVEGGDGLRVRFTPTAIDLLHGSEDARETFMRDGKSQ